MKHKTNQHPKLKAEPRGLFSNYCSSKVEREICASSSSSSLFYSCRSKHPPLMAPPRMDAIPMIPHHQVAPPTMHFCLKFVPLVSSLHVVIKPISYFLCQFISFISFVVCHVDLIVHISLLGAAKTLFVDTLFVSKSTSNFICTYKILILGLKGTHFY